jgi:hypothetical protein
MEAQVDEKTRPRRRDRAKHNKSKKPRETTIGSNTAEHKDTNPVGDVEPKPKKPMKVRYRKPKDSSRSWEAKEREHKLPAADVELSQDDVDDWLNMLTPNAPQIQTAAKTKNRSNRQRKPLDAKSDHHSNRRTDQELATRVEGPTNKSQSNRNASSFRNNQSSTAGSSSPKITIVRPPKGLKPQRKSKTSFLSLPRELRDMVYELSIDLSGITANVANEQEGFYKGMESIDSQHQPKKIIKLMHRLALRHGNLRTPTVLLVNRQVHNEAEPVLRKRTIVFEAPAINDATHLPLYQMVSQYLMRKVKSIHIVMAMKQHTDETMAGELAIGSNWFSHHTLENESLNYSLSWVHFLGDIIAMLWVPGASVQHIVFSITGGKAGDRSYILKPTQGTLNGLDKMLKTCVKTRKLEHFLGYLEYAEIPSDP